MCGLRALDYRVQSMRIIKHGKPPSEELYNGTCYKCKAIVECKKGELKYNACDSLDQRESPWYSVQCPTHECVQILMKPGAYAEVRRPYDR